MSTSTISRAPCTLHQDYLDLVDPETQRARRLTEIERSPAKLIENDLKEASSVIKLYLTALKNTTNALLQGRLEEFDATTGDHTCQTSASFAIMAFQDDELHAEAKRLESAVKQVIGKINLKTSSASSPRDLIEAHDLTFKISDKMDYLVRAYILRAGRVLSVSQTGVISLKVEASLIQSKLSRQCSPELIQKLISLAKEKMSLASLHFVQQELASSLKEEERNILCDPYVPSGITRHGGERLQYSCAFYNVKANLLTLAKQGVYFAVKNSEFPEKPILIFKAASSEPEIPHMEQVKETLPRGTPLFVIEGLGNLEETFECHGLIESALANIATYPQFLDMKKDQYAQDEDIAHLPEEQQSEIKEYREKGKTLSTFQIQHIYPTTV